MTGVFKANNPFNSFLLLIYGLVLKLPIFISPVVPVSRVTDGFLFKALLVRLSGIGNSAPVIYSFITFLLLYTQAIIFNRLVNNQRLMQKPNYLTAMAYLLITSLFAEWNILSAPLIINSFLIWVWSQMSKLYNDQNAKSSLFNIGAAIGLCTFFYFPSLAFAALIVFGLLVTRPFRPAEWIVALLGIITPYYFLFAYVFLTDKWSEFRFPAVAIKIPRYYESGWALAAVILVLFTTVTGFLYVQKNFRRQLVQTRKSWSLIFLYLIIALFIPFINATYSFIYWLLAAVPLAVLIGAAFLYPEKKWFSLVLHWLMVAFVIAFGYFIK